MLGYNRKNWEKHQHPNDGQCEDSVVTNDGIDNHSNLRSKNDHPHNKSNIVLPRRKTRYRSGKRNKKRKSCTASIESHVQGDTIIPQDDMLDAFELFDDFFDELSNPLLQEDLPAPSTEICEVNNKHAVELNSFEAPTSNELTGPAPNCLNLSICSQNTPETAIYDKDGACSGDLLASVKVKVLDAFDAVKIFKCTVKFNNSGSNRTKSKRTCTPKLLFPEVQNLTEDNIETMTKKIRNDNVRKYNLSFLYKTFGSQRDIGSVAGQYLVVMVIKDKVRSRGRADILSKSLIHSIDDLSLCVQKTFLIERNSIPTTKNVQDVSTLCSMYVADNLSSNVHFLVGEEGKQAVETMADTIPCEIISNCTNYYSNDQEASLNPVKVLNKSEDLKSLYNIVQKIATNTELLHIMFESRQFASSSRNSRRGSICSYNFGITNQDIERQEKINLEGGALPTLFNYNKLPESVCHAIMSYDAMVIQDLLPTMGLKEAFRGGGEYRKKYSALTRMALCQDDQNIYDSFRDFSEASGLLQDFDFIAPEAGTIGIFPCQSSTEPIEMLHPHIDCMNGTSDNFNHVIAFSAVYCFEDIEDKVLREKMKQSLEYSDIDWFRFVFIRYSRKIICDLDKDTSSAKRIPNMIKASNCVAEKDILNFVSDAPYTHWDYNFTMTNPAILMNLQRILNGGKVLVKKVKRFKLRGLRLNSQSAYTHGSVIINKMAAINKRCYDSAPADQTFSFAVYYGIDDIDCLLVMAMFFGIYCSGPSVYVQALESLMNGRYKEKGYPKSRETLKTHILPQHFEDEPSKLAWVLSTQIGFENKERGTNSTCGYSTEQRAQHPNMKLPHNDKKEWEIFKEKHLPFLKKRMQQFWECTHTWLDPTNGASPPSSFTQRHSENVYAECTKFIQDMCDHNIKGAKHFTCMTFVQFSAVLGLLPAECASFAQISNSRCGSFKFFDERLGKSRRVNESDKDKIAYYNNRLQSISKKLRKVHVGFSPTKVENIACEMRRIKKKEETKSGKGRAIDPIFCFKHRKDHFDQCMKNDEKLHGYTAGLQNFFDVQWDNKTNRMAVFIARGFGKKVKLVPLYNYIDVNGKDGKITFKTKGVMPYNVFPDGDLSQECLVVSVLEPPKKRRLNNV